MHRPRGIQDARAENVLREDIEAARDTGGVLPGDDRAARAILDDDRKILATRSCGHGQAVRGPARINPAGGQHVLSVDVHIAHPGPRIPPCDERAARAIRDDGLEVLISHDRAQRHAVGRPRAIHHARCQHVLGEEVDVVRGVAEVLPGYDRSPRAVRHDHGRELRDVRTHQSKRIRQQRLAVVGPGRIQIARCEDVPGEDVDPLEAVVLPCDDCPARAVRGGGGVQLVLGRSGDGAPELRPVG